MQAVYIAYFGAVAGKEYVNPAKGFASCFLSLADGARIELMTTTALSPIVIAPGAQRMGLTHIANFRGIYPARRRTHEKTLEPRFPDLGRSAATGDGYYESVTLDPDGNAIEITA